MQYQKEIWHYSLREAKFWKGRSYQAGKIGKKINQTKQELIQIRRASKKTEMTGKFLIKHKINIFLQKEIP